MSGHRSTFLSADLRGKGATPTNHCWCQKTRVIAVLCGIKIFAVRCLVFSQYTHLTDGQTDRQNCDSNTVRCITCSRTVKMFFLRPYPAAEAHDATLDHVVGRRRDTASSFFTHSTPSASLFRCLGLSPVAENPGNAAVSFYTTRDEAADYVRRGLKLNQASI